MRGKISAHDVKVAFTSRGGDEILQISGGCDRTFVSPNITQAARTRADSNDRIFASLQAHCCRERERLLAQSVQSAQHDVYTVAHKHVSRQYGS